MSNPIYTLYALDALLWLAIGYCAYNDCVVRHRMKRTKRRAK